MSAENGALSERKKLILKAIVDAHIQNGEPVGSKYLTQNKQISHSSATIRNEMAELEALGYLEQPHTSVGMRPAEVWGCSKYPRADSSAISFRMVAEDTALSSFSTTVLEPTGSPLRI